MSGTAETTDERLNELVDEVARLTGETYVTAMCRALEERRDRLVVRRSASHSDSEGPPGRVLHLSLEIPEEMLIQKVAPNRDRGA
jgi:hypothetical protein